MSAMGDQGPKFELFDSTDTTSCSGDGSSWGRMSNVLKPFTVLQALGDPLVGWYIIGTNNPQAFANSGSGNVILVLTKAVMCYFYTSPLVNSIRKRVQSDLSFMTHFLPGGMGAGLWAIIKRRIHRSG